MKTKVATFFLLICTTLSFAQNDWLPTGTTWTFEHSYFSTPQTDVNEHTIIGDTIIQSKTCQIVRRSKTSCDIRPIEDYLYKQNDSLFYYDSTKEDFSLLYDFSAEIGEIYPIHPWEGMNVIYDTVFVRIDSIATFYLDTLALKEFHVSYGGREDNGLINFESHYIYNPSNIIIEDIGSLGNLFHVSDNGWCDASYNGPLLCFDHAEYGNIQFGIQDCAGEFPSYNWLPVGSTWYFKNTYFWSPDYDTQIQTIICLLYTSPSPRDS